MVSEITTSIFLLKDYLENQYGLWAIHSLMTSFFISSDTNQHTMISGSTLLFNVGDPKYDLLTLHPWHSFLLMELNFDFG